MRARIALALVSAATLTAVAAGPNLLSVGHADTGNYQQDDYAHGQIDSILPPGENGLVNATQLVPAEAGTRPAGSNDQLAKYTNLIYGAGSLTDSNLTDYYDDESFGVKPADIVRTETPVAGATIYRDTHDVPHIYADNDAALFESTGYAQAEDRLFLMDVLRHYGEGTLSSFLGPSCDFEEMDHDQLLLAPYTQAQAQAQLDALPTEYGAEGRQTLDLINNFVQGINDYVQAALTNPSLLPADYAAALLPPQKWTATDVIGIAGLIGGLLGKGGGDELQNSALYEYLQKTLGATGGAQAFADFKDSNDPDAPTTVVDKTFPYMIPGTVDPATTALPDSTTLTGGPVDTTANCDLGSGIALPTGVPASAAHDIQTLATGLKTLPAKFSNALVVNADHSADGHPIAVFGPQVSYFAPQILMEEDLHSPDYDAEGASFPGTGVVELGRGEDFAWSATSATSDLIDTRLEVICDPNGGTPAANGTYYEFDGQCLPMTNETFSETALTKPGGTGAPVTLTHDIHLTRHGVVQGWTTAGGKPVAVVQQRSDYNHEVDSVIGFLRWGEPAYTHDATTWMQGAAAIDFTFNWLYVDDRDTAIFTSGLDPVRPTNINPNLPTWGTGGSEWQGFLTPDQHVHEIDPAKGYLVSWNNKPAPGFSAADDDYGYGPVYRSQLLTNQLDAQLAAHGGKVTRAEVVQAMSTASTQDLDGTSVLPELLQYVKGRTEPAGVTSMIATLQAWADSGAHRKKANPGDAQYADAAAVASMDELEDQLIQAVFDPILKAGGTGGAASTGGAVTPAYNILPMQWVNTPNSGDAHLGSAYDGGYEGYLVKFFRQQLGQKVAQPFGSAITSTWCGAGGNAACGAAIDNALLTTYDNLVTANGGSTTVSSWTLSPALKADQANTANETMPQYDAIVLRALGIVGQPNQDWQNRPTFQQVAEFPDHRARAAVTTTTPPKKTTKPKAPVKKKVTHAAAPGGTLAYTGGTPLLAAGALLLLALAALAARRPRRRS